MLSPGDHDLAEVIRRMGRFLHRDYSIEDTDAPPPKFRLQSPVALDAGDCEWTVGRIALGRGLGLVTGEGGGRWIWLQGAEVGTLRETATEREPVDLLGRQVAAAWIRTELVVDSPQDCISLLRPFMSNSGLLPEKREGALGLVGPTPTVEAALRILIHRLDLPIALENVDRKIQDDLVHGQRSESGVVRIAHAGRTLRDVVDKVAFLTGTNHLIDPRIGTAALHQDVELSPGGELRTLSRLAAEQDLVLLPLAPGKGIYEWICAAGSRGDDVYARAEVVSNEVVQALDATVVLVKTIVKLKPGSDSGKVLKKLRLGRQHGSFKVEMGVFSGGLLLAGPASDVAEAIRVVRKN